MPYLLLAAGLLAACTGDATPLVETVAVEAGAVTETVSAPGAVEAADRQSVRATAPGVVARIRAEDGDRVEAGDVVVRLASDEVDLALEQAEAAQAALAASQAPVRVDPPGDAALAAARASVADLDAEVKPDLADARRKARRIDDPAQREAAEATIALLAEAHRDVRRALLAAGEAAAVQQNTVAASFAGALNQALTQAGAGQAAQAASAADTAAARADGLRLRAPFAGVVQLGGAAATPALPDDLGAAAGAADGAGALAGGLGGSTGGGADGRLRVGSPVSPGQTLFTVYDLSRLYVSVDVDEVDAPQLDVGQSAEVLLDAFPDRTFAGEVAEVAIAARTSPTGGVAYPVRILLRDAPADDGPRVGMTASAEITTRTVRSALTVPARAVVRRGGGQAVYVVRDGRAVVAAVEVVALGEERAAVRSEQLRDDDRVIVSGYEDLTDGASVRVEP